MAELSITATQVLPGAEADGAVFESGIAGATITAGQAVYYDSVAGTFKLAQNDGTAAEAVCRGIALHGASSGQPLRIQTEGPITLGAGAAPAVGNTYCVGATAGSICLDSDVANPKIKSILGVGKASNVLYIKRYNSAQVVAA